MQITIDYFAILREQAGRDSETLDTGASTPRQLYSELAARHGFELHAERLRVAVNDEFCDWSQPLADGDRLVFIPPVAGG